MSRQERGENRRWTRLRFTGHIAGAGTTGGTRLVLGCWSSSPHGPFADVMVQRPDGHRILLAPDPWVADFVSTTYTFDEVRQVPVRVQGPDAGAAAGSSWHVTAGPLDWTFDVGRRVPLGHLLRAVPGPVGSSLTMARLTDRVARVVMPGVRTVGTAGNDRTEWYAARDLHRLASSRASWDGEDLGALADLDPPADFGFSSAPRFPSLTALTSTVRVPR
ncbi:hypothetical protein AB0333_09840 [Citricoccus sp. NPDC079358]|uniref:hypothetical protein n=1 Tax=Citricoccus sp. NPDC079358 TaxID=3154653 RepID=UPI00344E454A